MTPDSVADEKTKHRSDQAVRSQIRTARRPRATRYLRKFYPWYVERLGGDHALQNSLQTAEALGDVRAALGLRELARAA